MSNNRKFSAAYVALVALFWDALERIDRSLDAAGEDWQEMQVSLQLLRMELLHLGDCSRQAAGTALLSSEQNVLMQRFVARLLGRLEIDVLATREVAMLRVRSAQNWLFDEACQQHRHDTATELHIRHG